MENPVMGRRGMVASPHYLASLAGARMLMAGGNAVDAAIAANAVLGVVYPHNCGIGGDLFMLIYSAKDGELIGLNASGRSPARAARDFFAQKGLSSIPLRGILSVTVPGAVDGWSLAQRRFGKMSLDQLLQPAIEYAEGGFPITARLHRWIGECAPVLSQHEESRQTFLPNDSIPQPGQILKFPHYANSLKMIATQGPEVFYHGALAESISRFCEAEGGLLRLEDLASHRSEWVAPIHTSYSGYEVYELPPNTQGLATLLELNLAENFNLGPLGHNSGEYIHLLAEIKKIAFADRDAYITDPEFSEIPVQELLSKDYAKRCALRIDRSKANPAVHATYPPGGDTIYLCAADASGNLVSLIQSLYFSFGSGVAVKDTGVLLQNRGSYFSLQGDHINRLEPVKRTMHTLIPAMAFRDGKPVLVFGTMGGEGQPQTQLQVLCNLIHFRMNLQQAINAPRWLMGPRHQGGPPELYLEGGISQEAGKGLEAKGHAVKWLEERSEFFGHAHAIAVVGEGEQRIYEGAADPRSDGCAIAW